MAHFMHRNGTQYADKIKQIENQSLEQIIIDPKFLRFIKFAKRMILMIPYARIIILKKK